MNKFNLTTWALKHKQLIYYFMIVIFLAGIFSYKNLGRMEFPDFTIRQMVVVVQWPGATAKQMEEQVVDKIEKRLQDTPGLDNLSSCSQPGQSIIYVSLKEASVKSDAVRPTWLEVRNMVNDIKDTLPQGIRGPYFNDRFDDVFGNIYALTGDGYSYEELRKHAEDVRQTLLGVPSVKKVDLVGVQQEEIFIDLDSSKLAQLGVDPSYVIGTIQAQNSVVPAGMVQTKSDDVYLRVDGLFQNLTSIRNLPVQANGRVLKLGDVAKVTRSYADPASSKMFYNGQPAIGVAISMEKGGNILTLGKNLDQTIDDINGSVPVGLHINQVANQPDVVKEAINEFIVSLVEAIAIVLIVCFISLGMRAGMIVGMGIPLVICGVFACMKIVGIDLQNISLGALIIAMGLLVDDEIITLEMMSVKLEQGMDRMSAAAYSYSSTAMPRLTGALITCAAFMPVGFSAGAAAEMAGSIFWVVAIALIISWLVAGTITPLLAHKMIEVKKSERDGHDIYQTKFYQTFRSVLAWCLVHRKLVILTTVGCFLASILLMTQLKQEFFPASSRPELMVSMKLPEGTSIKKTEKMAAEFAACLKGNKDITDYSYYVGQSAPRFVLTATPEVSDSNYAQFVIIAKDSEARTHLNQTVEKLLADKFYYVRGKINIVQFGPSDPYPIMFRVSGEDEDKVRSLAKQVTNVMNRNSSIKSVNWNWHEKSKVMRLTIDQDRARLLGINTQNLASSLQAQLSGQPISQFIEDDKSTYIAFRLNPDNAKNLTNIKDLNISVGDGKFVPLDQIARISYDAESGMIWRRDLKPTITVQADITNGASANNVAGAIDAELASMREKLPAGYSIKVGGAYEMSQQALGWLLGPVPLMVIIIITLLMLQLQSMTKTIMTLLTAPLGMIGVSLSLVITQRPMGFVVELGILALMGIIMRNSVILIDQIDQQIESGEEIWNAIIHATVMRFRPIMLTAAAAVLSMVPLAWSVFWGPMAVALGGGLLVATALTLIVLPTLYAAFYRVKRPD